MDHPSECGLFNCSMQPHYLWGGGQAAGAQENRGWGGTGRKRREDRKQDSSGDGNWEN